MERNGIVESSFGKASARSGQVGNSASPGENPARAPVHVTRHSTADELNGFDCHPVIDVLWCGMPASQNPRPPPPPASSLKASILFLSYQHREFVGAAIRSAMAQDFPELELVVCDDGSTDGTREILEHELRNCPPHVRPVRCSTERNVGLVANFNRGMAACTGDIIINMSGDDISEPGRVSGIVAVFSRHPRCMLVFSNWTWIDGAGVPRNRKAGHPCENRTFSHGTMPDDLFAGSKGPGATAAYRTCLPETFGPMRPMPQPEDRCYWFRALLLGEIHYLADPLVRWRTHAGSLTNYSNRSDTPAARAKILRGLLQRQNYGRQYQADIRTALEQSHITPVISHRLDRLIRSERERLRLVRLSLLVAPRPLWLAAARRCAAVSPSPRTFKMTVLNGLMIRLFPSKREKFWKKRIKGSPASANSPPIRQLPETA